MPTEIPSRREIDHLIGSPTYRDSRHPQCAATRNAVTNWFAAQYGTDNRIDEGSIAKIGQSHAHYFHENYIARRALVGRTLLIGEGNLSFTISLVFDHRADPSFITATIHEKDRDISDETRINARKLSKAGVNILDNVDATFLDRAFPHRQFDTIIFQFPNAGSREPNRGHNPNFVLVRRFLKSAAEHLRRNGEIIVTVVNSSYYDGRFRIEEAADYAGIRNFYAIPFSPDDFPSYAHVNTNDEDSALKEHRSFETWVFQP